jgi:hypothetical protein
VFASSFLHAVSIVTTTLPNATVGNPYLAVIRSGGGCAPLKWTLVSGKLPAGVTLASSSNSASVNLIGKPTVAGSYSFTVSVTGCSGGVAKKAFIVATQARALHVVELAWQPSTTSTVTGYNVYRGPDGSTWTKINPSLVASTLFDDSTVANTSTYFYAVTAMDVLGNESKKTAAVKAAVP